MPSSFVHLHCHSEYSFLDSTIRIQELVNTAANLDMPAVAITDHGNLHGAINLYKAAKKAGINPIIGMEAYVTNGSIKKKRPHTNELVSHITLLASNLEGYHNLVKLTTTSHLQGFTTVPRVDANLLANHTQGLIALSGCLKSDLNTHILQGDTKTALHLAAQWREIFGKDNYFIEIQDHGLEAQLKSRPDLLHIARDLGLGIVATNDVHFLHRQDHEFHNILLCIGSNTKLPDSSNRPQYSPEQYFKSPREMLSLFPDLPEAIHNSLEIAQRCTLNLEFGKPKYPSYTPPNGLSQADYLRQLCQNGLHTRYGQRASTDPDLQARLDYELSIIEKTGFLSYFLIVWDFIHHAKSIGIPVGPGRGSAAGSLVAYVLGITDVDPIRFGLIFERFLNPERISPPDIDVDFCMVRRPEIIQYVRDKYGEPWVSNIITYNTLGARSVVRDVARALGWRRSDADRLALLIPSEKEITLQTAAEKLPEIQAAIENDEQTALLWKYASKIEGLCRNASVHPAGIVIGDRPLEEFIPLCLTKDNVQVTQYEMGALSDLGILKMDFLGLTTLTVIQTAVQLIQKQNPQFNISQIPDNDQAAFDIYNRGEVVGIFQMEGVGATYNRDEFKIQSLDDIIALGALIRPGPNNFLKDFTQRKIGRQKVEYLHPLLEKVCADTYGIMVYQEQVQRAANVLAGYSLGQADLLRRAMGKKDAKIMANERQRFVEGCQKLNNIPATTAEAIFNFIQKFAEYGFNKSHSAAYGLISYQTAFLKAHYPVEFMAALLNHDVKDTARLTILTNECRRMGISILPPSINHSGPEFQPAHHGHQQALRFGLGAIKNVGHTAAQAILAEREHSGPFTSLQNFCERLSTNLVNRKALESLIKAGAFDDLADGTPGRSRLLAALDKTIASAAATHRDRATGQAGLFDQIPIAETSHPLTENSLPDIPPWPPSETLAFEKELLGCYISGHPLDDYSGHFDSHQLTPIASAKNPTKDATLDLAGVITSLTSARSKNNSTRWIATIEDFSDSLEITIWDDTYQKFQHLLHTGSVLRASVQITKRDGYLRAVAKNFSPLKPRPSQRPCILQLDYHSLDEPTLLAIAHTARQNPGPHPLILEITLPNSQTLRLRAAKEFSTSTTTLSLTQSPSHKN